MYSHNGCMQKQAADGHTLTNPAAYPYELAWTGTNYESNTAYTVRPAALATTACKNCTCTVSFANGDTIKNTSEYHNCTACECIRDATNSHAALDALGIEATFDGDFCSLKNCIKISDTTEESFYHVGEWSEYIATFFNKELEVKGLADTARLRWTGEKNGIITQLGYKEKGLAPRWLSHGCILLL